MILIQEMRLSTRVTEVVIKLQGSKQATNFLHAEI